MKWRLTRSMFRGWITSKEYGTTMTRTVAGKEEA